MGVHLERERPQVSEGDSRELERDVLDAKVAAEVAEVEPEHIAYHVALSGVVLGYNVVAAMLRASERPVSCAWCARAKS
jgi:hypothetical protein